MDFYFLIYFFVGVLQDFLATMNVRYIAKEKIILASASSFVTTVITLIVFYNILTGLDGERSIFAIVIYALGIGTGTILAMKLKMKSGIKK